MDGEVDVMDLHKKSWRWASVAVYGMRTMVAMLPLRSVSKQAPASRGEK